MLTVPLRAARASVPPAVARRVRGGGGRSRRAGTRNSAHKSTTATSQGSREGSR